MNKTPSPNVVISVRLLYPLVFGSPVLEPDLDLRFRQGQQLCQLQPARASDVLLTAELQLQLHGLLAAERRALTSRPLLAALAARNCEEQSERYW